LVDRLAASGLDGVIRSLTGPGSRVAALQRGKRAVILINSDLTDARPLPIDFDAEDVNGDALAAGEVRVAFPRPQPAIVDYGQPLGSAMKAPRIVIDKVTPRVVATCTQCQLGCREAWLKCSIASSQSSLTCGSHAPSCYLASANATCDAAAQRCFSSCKSSGACCPDFCKGSAACCESAWGCCPPAPQAARPPAAKSKGRPAARLEARAQQDWSSAWPTCPRCGPPVAAASTAPNNPRGN